MIDNLPSTRRVLVAGLGNVLRGDDGFGPAVIQQLEAEGNLPPGVHTLELGIGGVGLVHELMNGYDALVLVDAMDQEGAPGTLYIRTVTVPEVATISDRQRYELGSDMHQTVPTPALLMARAVGALPPLVHIVGCQPAETEEFSLELSQVVQQTVPAAIVAIHRLVRRALAGETAAHHSA
jgi:hydrogenase maturation protease